MITNSFVLIAIIALISCSNQSKLSESDVLNVKQEVKKAFDNLVISAKSLDVDRYMAHFDSTKFSGINSNGTVYKSSEDFKSIYQNGVSYIDYYSALEFPVIKITVINKTTAILVNEFKTNIKLKSGSDYSGGGAGTQVWNKDSGKWKLVSVSGSDK